MLFANMLMLIGLSAALIPIILHLLNRGSAEPIEWGAMQFLLGSVVSRSRQILIEEMLLLALRCLLLALLALAMALPFVPPGSTVPWGLMLPAVLLGAALLGAGTVLWDSRGWRWGLVAAGALLLLLAVTAGLAERWLQSHRWQTSGGGRDIAIVIDGSASMEIEVDGKTNFDRAIDEARTLAAALGPRDGASVIVAGLQPRLVLASPVVSRKQVAGAIARARLTGGRMAVHDALEAAAATLDEGRNPNRTIILITDGQAAGWKSSGDVNWELLAETFKGEEPKPQLIVRVLPVLRSFRNVGIADIRLSRDVIGPDRPVAIHVKVENTGGETIEGPLKVALRVDGEPEGEAASVATLQAGAAETVTFRPQFDRSGAHTIEARVAVDDDFASDNTAARAIQTLHRLPVLVIEGNASTRPLDWASAYIKSALAPLPLPEEKTGPESKKAPAAPPVDLVDLTVWSAEHTGSIPDFSRWRVVILAGVPRLRSKVSQRLAKFVAHGGGLLIAPGENALPDFYNGWKTAGGVPVVPATIGKRWTETAKEKARHPAATTFAHRGFRLVRDKVRSDIASAGITACWRLEPDATDRNVSVCGSFDNGDPFAIERRLGEGRVLMTAVSLDARGSDLPALGTFAPFVHELVTSLIRPPEGGLEFNPADKIALTLADEEHGATGKSDRLPLDVPGLRADYFADRHFGLHRSTTIDKTPNFSWGRNPPAPGVPIEGFSVRWTGSFIAPKPGEYTFGLRGHQGARLWIDGKLLIEATAKDAVNTKKYKDGHKPGKIRLTGEPQTIRVEYQGAHDSYIYLHCRGADKKWVNLEKALRVGKPWQYEFPPGTAVTVTPPSGPEVPVVLEPKGRALLAGVDAVHRPGVYQLALPEFITDSFRHVAIGGKVPFVVRSSPEESHLATLSDEDFNRGAKVFPLAAARSTEDAVRALTGKVPGRRLWRYLAMAALVAVLLEVALTRWIAMQRRLGATRQVDFTSAATNGQGFRSKALSGFGLSEQPTEGQ